MKTIQEYLRNADRGQLLAALANDALYNTIFLLEYKEKTIDEIQNAVKVNMNAFIDHLPSLKTKPSDHMVMYMNKASSFDRRFNHEDKTLFLIDINEIRKDLYASSYAFEMSPWEKTLGYLVADNKLTQDYKTDLLTQYLHEISFFGTVPEKRQITIDEIHADLDQSMKEIEEGKTIPAEKVFNDLAEEFGFPLDEEDDFQDELKKEIFEAEFRYSRYCHWRERSRILTSLGYPVPTFEEAEKMYRE